VWSPPRQGRRVFVELSKPQSLQLRLRVAVASVDFRCGIDGLARLCREVLSSDPCSGAVFVFRNRRGTAVKLLTYDG
jgi:transposase